MRCNLTWIMCHLLLLWVNKRLIRESRKKENCSGGEAAGARTEKHIFISVMRNRRSEKCRQTCLQRYRGNISALQPFVCVPITTTDHEEAFLFFIYRFASGSAAAARLWRCGTAMPAWWGSNRAVEEESFPRFIADPAGHITTGLQASLDTRKHENHWNNYTR